MLESARPLLCVNFLDRPPVREDRVLMSFRFLTLILAMNLSHNLPISLLCSRPFTRCSNSLMSLTVAFISPWPCRMNRFGHQGSLK